MRHARLCALLKSGWRLPRWRCIVSRALLHSCCRGWWWRWGKAGPQKIVHDVNLSDSAAPALVSLHPHMTASQPYKKVCMHSYLFRWYKERRNVLP